MNCGVAFKKNSDDKMNNYFYNYKLKIKEKKTQYYREKKEVELKKEELNIEENREVIEGYISACLNNPIDMYPYIHGKKHNDNLVLRYFSNPSNLSMYAESSGEILCDMHVRSTGYNFDEKCMGLLGYGVWCLVNPEYDKVPYMTNFERDILKYKYVENFPSEIFYDIYSFTERYCDEGPWDNLIEKIEIRIDDEKRNIIMIEEENDRRVREHEYYMMLKEEEEEKANFIEELYLENDINSQSDSD